MGIDLRNLNHGFDLKPGEIGCTIRKGMKYTMMHPGDILELYECDAVHQGSCKDAGCTFHGQGQVIGYWYGKWEDVPDALVSIEHNLSARDREICEEMLRAGCGSLEPSDIVTALVYLRLS